MSGSTRGDHYPADPVQQGAWALTPSEGASASSDEEVEKRSAWNQLSNGAIEAGSVMGAKFWPPLSESSKASLKLPSSAVLNNATEGSDSKPTGNVTSKYPPMSPSNKSASCTGPIRQQSLQRVGSGAASSANILPNDDLVTQPPSVPSETTPASSGQNSASTDPPRDPSSRNSGNWDHGSRSGRLTPQAGRNENYRAYGSGGHRRGNNLGGPHNKFGTRREQDGGHDWNLHSSLFPRGMQLPHQQRPFQRPVINVPMPGQASFLNPPSPVPVQPYMIQDMYPPMLYIPTPTPPPDLFTSLPYITSPTMFYPPSPFDHQLSNALLRQIHYYFSFDNLCKDVYLRQNMDEEGWVPISLIASFNRVKSLTTDIPFILETVRSSSNLEVQDDKIRRRGDWKSWILHSPKGPPSTLNASYELLSNAVVAQVKNMGLTSGASHQQLPVRGRLPSGELSSQSR